MMVDPGCVSSRARLPVEGASLSGSASSRIIRVEEESGVGASGGGERGWRAGGDRRRPAICRAGGVRGGEEAGGLGWCRCDVGGL